MLVHFGQRHDPGASRASRRSSAAIATAALAFLPIWLIGAGINLRMGVCKAGYSIKDEAPIFLIVFAVPAAAASAWCRYFPHCRLASGPVCPARRIVSAMLSGLHLLPS